MRGRTALLAPAGEMDHCSVPALDHALKTLPVLLDGVLLDMSGVTFMDSAGLNFLHRLAAYGHRHAIPVLALHWSGQPRRTLELSGCRSRYGLPAKGARP